MRVEADARLDASDLLIEPVSGAGVPELGTGVVVTDGTLGLTGATIRGVGLGLDVAGTRGDATVDGLLVHDVGAPAGTTALGVGVRVSGGASLTLTHSAIVRADRVGALVAGAGSRLDASVLFAADVGDPTRAATLTVAAAGGATASLACARIERPAIEGVNVAGAGTHVDASDLVVLDARPRSDGEYGRAFEVNDRATATVTRARFERLYDIGAYVANAGSRMELVDVRVADTRVRGLDDRWGYGIEAEFDGLGVVRRAWVERSDSAAFFATQGGRLEVEDSVAIDAAGRVLDGGGTGLTVGSGTVVVQRSVIFGSLSEGVSLLDGASATLTDVAIEEVRGDRIDASRGYGLVVGAGAQLDATRLHLRRARDAAIAVVGTDARATLTDVTVSATEAAACCPGTGSMSVAVTDGGQLDLTSFRLEQSELCGVYVDRAGDLDLHVGLVTSHPIGACILEPDYDLARLTDRVTYRDNDVDLATSLP